MCLGKGQSSRTHVYELPRYEQWSKICQNCPWILQVWGQKIIGFYCWKEPNKFQLPRFADSKICVCCSHCIISKIAFEAQDSKMLTGVMLPAGQASTSEVTLTSPCYLNAGQILRNVWVPKLLGHSASENKISVLARWEAVCFSIPCIGAKPLPGVALSNDFSIPSNYWSKKGQLSSFQ